MWKFSELDSATRDALPDSKFAWIDKDGGRHLPIHNAGHVRNALARIDQTKGLSGLPKKAALAKIKSAAAKFGIDSSKQARESYAMSEAPSYGPGGSLDWDDDEEPDESEDGNRPGETSGGPGYSQADEGTPTPAPGMDAGDVHVNAPVNSEPGIKKRSPAMRKLAGTVRAHFASGRLLASDQFEKMYRASIGHAGGKSRRADEQGMEGIDVRCCLNSCGMCQGAGCGCCDACYVEPSEMDSDGDFDGDGEDDAEQSELRQYTEGSAHYTTPDGTACRFFFPHEFGPAKKAGEWIEYMPEPGEWDSERYGKIAITRERNQRFVENFNAGVYQKQIPVDAEHESKLSGALGWIGQGGMRLNEDGSVAAHVEWTDRGRTMLAEKRFRYFSPEWYDSWKEPASGKQFDDVVIGGALTTRPFFKESSLQPLIASERGVQMVRVKQPDAEGTKMANEATNAAEAAEAAKAAEAKKFSELEQRNADLEKQLAESKTASEAANAERKQFAEDSKKLSERLEAIESADRRRQFTETAKAFSGETAKHVAFMERHANEEDVLKDYVELQTGIAAQLQAAEKMLFQATGVSTAQANGQGSVVDQVRQAAEAAVTASGGKKNRVTAMAEQWNDETYAEYLAQTGN